MVCQAVGEEVTATKAKQLLRFKYEEQLLKTVCVAGKVAYSKLE